MATSLRPSRRPRLAAAQARVLVALLLVLGLPGCASDPLDEFFPLEAGRSWHYVLTVSTMDGTERQVLVLRDTGAGELDGRPVQVRRALDGAELVYARTEDGVLRVAHRGAGGTLQRHEPPEMVLPAEPVVGARWQGRTTTKVLKKTGPPQRTEYRIQVGVPMDYTLEEEGLIVQVPAGRFEDCLRIRGVGDVHVHAGNYVGRTRVTVEQNEWYCPGVGLAILEREERTRSPALDRGGLNMQLQAFR